MKDKLQVIRDRAIRIQAFPGTITEKRDNIMLQAMIIQLTEDCLKQLEEGENDGIQQDELGE